jgi:acetolactate synthase-1/2/3 large subunit
MSPETMSPGAFAAKAYEAGISFAAGVPGGGSSLALADALNRAGVSFITTGHESTAALMAGAAGRIRGLPGLCLSIKGPGLASLLPGLLCCRYENFPLLAFAEAYPTDVGPGPHRRHKWLNHWAMAGQALVAYGRFGGKLPNWEDAARRALLPLPGPVLVDLAGEEGWITTGVRRREKSPPQPLASRRRILVVGSAALRAPWAQMLTRLEVPIFTTVAAKGALDETLPQAAGIFTGDAKPGTPEHTLFSQAEEVVFLDVPSGERLNPRSAARREIHVRTHEGSGFPPPGGDPESEVMLAEDYVNEWLASAFSVSWGLEETARALAVMRSRQRELGWTPFTAMELADHVLPKARHVLDTGNFTVAGEHALVARSVDQVLGTPNGRWMGAGIGLALGAALTDRSRACLLWIGDGGIRAHIGELALAARRKLPLAVLLMRDGYFGSIRTRAIQQGFDLSPLVVSSEGNLAALEAWGFSTAFANSPESLEQVLMSWDFTGSPLVVDCAFPPDVYQSMADELR